MRKSEYHHGNLKETFLKIAFEFIKNNDIDKLTLKILSDTSNTSRSAIYSHFSSKESLIEAIILHGFIKFDDYLSPALKNKDIDLLQRIEAAAKNYIEFARENIFLYRLLFGHKYAHTRMEVMTKNDPHRSGFAALMLAIEEGQSHGIFKIESSFKQSITIWSTLHGLTSLLIDGFIGIEDMYDELFQDMLSNILSGLLIK